MFWLGTLHLYLVCPVYLRLSTIGAFKKRDGRCHTYGSNSDRLDGWRIRNSDLGHECRGGNWWMSERRGSRDSTPAIFPLSPNPGERYTTTSTAVVVVVWGIAGPPSKDRKWREDDQRDWLGNWKRVSAWSSVFSRLFPTSPITLIMSVANQEKSL